MAAPYRVGLPLVAWSHLFTVLLVLLTTGANNDDIYDLLLILMTEWLPWRQRTHRTRGRDLRVRELSEQQAQHLTGFRRSDLFRLVSALGFGGGRTVRSSFRRYVCSGETAILIVLVRLHDGRRWSELEDLFRRDHTQLSELFAETVHMLLDEHRHRLEDLSFFKPRMPGYAAAIRHACTAKYPDVEALSDIWAFIDGTLRPCARPSAALFPGMNIQMTCYSGHKRRHGLRYQAVTTPDGLIAHMFGPLPGRRHDLTLLRQSGLLEQLDGMYMPNEQVFRMYGDPAYRPGAHIATGYPKQRNVPLGDLEYRFNRAMSSARICVEWSFKEINCRLAYYLNDIIRMKLGKSAAGIGNIYVVSALLTNCLVCCEGCQTSVAFGVPPPSLEEYLA
ncbi:DDE Tnp4 domain-containing protein [Pseudoscourfieldia marina]